MNKNKKKGQTTDPAEAINEATRQTLQAVAAQPRKPRISGEAWRLIQKRQQANTMGHKDSAELLRAIRAVGRGDRYLPPEISLLLAKSEHSSHLTARELGILKLVAQGKANKEIGELLSLSENTVKNHVKSILAKLSQDARVTDLPVSVISRSP